MESLSDSPKRGPLIGYGRTAEIFLWGDNQIIKLFREDWPLPLVEREAKIGQAIYETGLPAPAVSGVLELERRNGIVFERVQGRTMLQEFSARPWTILQLVRVFTDLHVVMHGHSVPALPSQRERIANDILHASAVGQEVREAAIGILNDLPDGETLCHGDFHPDQIMMSPWGPVIIDWSTAACGNPIADVATTSLLLRLAEPSPGRISSLVSFARAFVHWRYLKGYLKKKHVEKVSVDSWALPIAVARLSAGIPEEQGRLLGMIRRLV